MDVPFAKRDRGGIYAHLTVRAQQTPLLWVQAGLAVRYGAGARLPMRGLAPYLGGDSETLLQRYAGVASEEFHGLVADGIVCLEPTQLRGS